ncbi:MAG: cytochrome P450 [Actinomycetota bacterium]
MVAVSGDATTSPPGPGRTPPVAGGLPVIGIAPQLLRDPYRFLYDAARQHGDVVRLNVPGLRLVLVNHPDHVAHVFSRHADRYGKGRMNTKMADGSSYLGLPLADGEPWKRVRRLLNPMFGQKRLRELSSLMAEAIDERVGTWERHRAGEIVNLDPELSGVTMAVLLRSMFSTDVADDDVDRSVADFRAAGYLGAIKMLTAWAPAWFPLTRLPLPIVQRGVRAQRGITEFMNRIIASRRANPTDASDVLNMLLEARFDDGAPMTDDELRVELFGLLFGGFETTASALAWTFALLDRHPDIAARAVSEVDALGQRPVTFDDLPHLKFVRACFDEAQRIQGGVLFTREAVVDDEIGGYRIRKGTVVAVSPYALHHDERFFPQPERFDPDRFLTAEIDKFAFIPFGAGPRHCIGSNMAYIEAQFTIATVLQRYRVELEPGFEPRHHFHLSTGMKGGCPVRLHRRQVPGSVT